MLPGDRPKHKIISSIIRVNHAGEFGAKRIYQGQLDYTQDQETWNLINHMKKQEEKHLDYFANAIKKRRVRPTILMPLWHLYGYALGALTAKLGKTSAMACTESVEEVINEHYLDQLQKLTHYHEEKELKKHIEQFRQEELEHQSIAQQYDAAKAPMHKALAAVIKISCKFAIQMSKIF
jgi:ubiquinone biosynthesis monooxygenase Coq7